MFPSPPAMHCRKKKILLPEKRSTDNRLIISVAVLFWFCGFCQLIGVSPLLGCMSMSTVYINVTDDDKLFKQLNYFSPPFLLLFFVRSGVSFDLGLLLHSKAAATGASLLTLGVVYFIVRIIGKYTGALTGCFITHKHKLVRNYLGLALIPQAGVAIGLAELGARTLGGATGNSLRTVVLAASVLYELIGPACAKLSLVLSKSIPSDAEPIPEPENNIQGDGETPHLSTSARDVNFLIERIREIQAELPKHEETPENGNNRVAGEGNRTGAVLQSLRGRFHSNNIK